ncbi:unnamed protein product [Caenorhabditis brenneri]
MQYAITLQCLHFLSFIIFSVTVIIGCKKKEPSKISQNNSAKKTPSKSPDPPPSSHMYVDASCQPKSVMVTKQVTVTSKIKSKSTNPYVKTKSVEPDLPPNEPPKDAAKEMDKLREEANKEGEKKDEEDFGYENCGDISEDQLKKAKVAQSKIPSKGQTVGKPLAPSSAKPSIPSKRPMKT